MKIFKANRFANESADDLVESFKASGPALEQFFDKELGLHMTVTKIIVHTNNNIEVFSQVDSKKSKSFVNSPLLSTIAHSISIDFGIGYTTKSQTVITFDNPVVSLSDFSNVVDLQLKRSIVFADGKYSLVK